MQNQKPDCANCQLKDLCQKVKSLVHEGSLDQAQALCDQSLADHPDSPVVQNLIGVIDACRGDKPLALRHFAAAAALEPGYCPAIHNLDVFGAVFGHGEPAFDEEDCPKKSTSDPWEIREKDGIKYVERRYEK